ncbi:hypothetical protein [Helicobacter sp. 10-6591]|uniref:hypothetical protein n=1 Tax=Helicobacter sp. 10-6591 TaxID=2004998 RepID=UPI000DCB413A|nr:hypothetical protein [Helicobacter sp. 10-6591]RAX54778.1 hypothetical protein CCY97_05225 [Helicobacter sp. 10-6591]
MMKCEIAIGDILTILVTIITAAIAVRATISVFRKTTTLEAEIFFLNAYKNYMETDKKENAKNQFLTAIDLYCKYEVNGHLDEELSSNNTEFFKGAIQCFKDDIKKDLKGFDNINKYIKKYHIPLD